MDFNTEFERTKLDIMIRSDCVFIASILFSLETVIDDSIATAATDGRKLYLSPSFFMMQRRSQRIFLLLHEAFHVALKHVFRMKGKNLQKYNKAADYCINIMLSDMGLTMPTGGLLDFKYRGMSTEEIYNLLDDEEDDDTTPDIIPAPCDMEEGEIDTVITRASNQIGVLPGDIPQEVKRIIEEINDPKIDWRQALQNFMSAYAKDDYSWSKPNYLFSHKWYLPSLHSRTIQEIAIFIDVSGSISKKQLDDLVSEAAGIRTLLAPKSVSFHGFNTIITQSYYFDEMEPIQGVSFRGYGGTQIQCIADYVEGHRPEIVICMTDGAFAHVDMSHCTNLLWLIHSNKNFHYDTGTVICLEE